jgi:hypothetical protein
MDFFNLIEDLKKSDSSLIFYCLLNRIPIIIIGEDSDIIDNLLIDLSDLMHFRKEVVFYTDFISNSEYQELLQNEAIDYNSQRTHIRCSCDVSGKSLMDINQFNSWIMGFELDNDKHKLENFIKFIKEKIGFFLNIMIFSKSISISCVGLNLRQIDLTFEENILQKISRDTEKAIVKMKRVLLEKTKPEKLDKELIRTLLDFEVEKKELKKNILKNEIQKFYSGSKRSFFILSKLSLLNSFEMAVRIGSKTLLEIIDYDEATIGRMVSFIEKEWGEDFSNLFENGKKVNALDSMQSLWG